MATRRMLTDEELDAYIDELNDRESAGIQIDRSITIISVHGRLANVRWLEDLGAKKQKSGKFYEYEIELPSDNQQTTDVIRQLQRAEGVWFDESPKVRS